MKRRRTPRPVSFALDAVADQLEPATLLAQIQRRWPEAAGSFAQGTRPRYERDGELLFNTAFLLDRDGELVGTYRKVHLYWPEEREGISPGDALPVFDADFGRWAS